MNYSPFSLVGSSRWPHARSKVPRHAVQHYRRPLRCRGGFRMTPILVVREGRHSPITFDAQPSGTSFEAHVSSARLQGLPVVVVGYFFGTVGGRSLDRQGFLRPVRLSWRPSLRSCRRPSTASGHSHRPAGNSRPRARTTRQSERLAIPRSPVGNVTTSDSSSRSRRPTTPLAAQVSNSRPGAFSGGSTPSSSRAFHSVAWLLVTTGLSRSSSSGSMTSKVR